MTARDETRAQHPDRREKRTSEPPVGQAGVSIRDRLRVTAWRPEPDEPQEIYLVAGPALVTGPRPAFRCRDTARLLTELVNRLRTPDEASA